MAHWLFIAGIAVFFVLLVGGFEAGAFFVGIVLLLMLFIVVARALLSFGKEFAHTEFEELEKSAGGGPSGKEVEDLIEDAGEVLLNKNKPKGKNATERVSRGAEEFIEKIFDFFK